MIKENNKLLVENEKLRNQILKIKEEDKIGKHSYIELKKVLQKKEIKFPAKFSKNKKDWVTNYLEFFILYRDEFITGITNEFGSSELQSHIFYNICPVLISFGLLEINKVTGAKYRRIEMSKAGLDFVAKLEIEINS